MKENQKRAPKGHTGAGRFVAEVADEVPADGLFDDSAWTVPPAPAAVVVEATPRKTPTAPVPRPARRRRARTKSKGPAVAAGDRTRLNRECKECFGFPYHAKGCPKVE